MLSCMILYRLIIHLQHEWLMIGVQCQLVICRRPLGLPKGTFHEFWVCNVKIRKCLLGAARAYFLEASDDTLELTSLVKLDEKESLDPKMSGFE